MVRDTLFEDLSPGELGLLVTFLVVGTYMFVEAGSYSATIGLYPRLLSAVVVLCALLVLFQNVLPEAAQAYVAEPGGSLGSAADVPEDIDEDDLDTSAGATTDSEGTSRAQVVLTVLVAGYLLVSYLVGMYVVTPVFVVVYGVVYDLGWKMTLLLTAVASVAAHLFLTVFNAPVASGLLL